MPVSDPKETTRPLYSGIVRDMMGVKPTADGMTAAGTLLDLMWSRHEPVTKVELAFAFDAFAAKAVAKEDARFATRAWNLLNEAHNIIREHAPGCTVWLEEAEELMK